MKRDYKKIPEDELAALLSNSDYDSFAEIYNRFFPQLFRYAMRILRDQEAVQDILQDVFTAIWAKHHEIKISTSLSGYLYATTRYAVLAQLKRTRYITAYLNTLEKEIDRKENPTEHHLYEKELRQEIETEIDRLPPKMREVFKLSLATDHSYRELSEQLNISEGTVKKQIYYATKNLRARLEKLLMSIF